ncbi:MAG TPA: beta-galactosidase [Gemmatimonadaceae bacterium]|nr:beta-galactosidase [Gemmatimonadaceae bacterium]
MSSAAFQKPFSFSAIEDYDKGEDLAGVANDFRFMHELGIDTWRGSFGWDQLEPERGVYDFEWLHAFAETAASHGIRLRPYVGYTPAWAAAGRMSDEAEWNDPPADLSDWTGFVRALATAMRRHDNVVSYEIYNEQNARAWWDGTPTEYYHVLLSGAAAIRAADPGTQVLMGALVWPDDAWVRAVCSEPGGAAAFDIVPFHAYPETFTDDTVSVEGYLDAQYHDDFLPVVDSICGGKPVWLNELGFATVRRDSERAQANWWARAIATYAADRRVEHLGIYQLRDRVPPSPEMAGDPNHHFGLVYADGTRKLAFSTVQLLVALLNTDTITVADAEVEARLRARRERALHHRLFVRPDGRQVLIVWDNAGWPVLDIRLARTGSTAMSYALDGSARPHLAYQNGVLHNVRLERGEVQIFVIDP